MLRIPSPTPSQLCSYDMASAVLIVLLWQSVRPLQAAKRTHLKSYKSFAAQETLLLPGYQEPCGKRGPGLSAPAAQLVHSTLSLCELSSAHAMKA